MSEAVATAMGNAAQSLRDTAKWLVGGVAATAAGVFAGSSLTSFGSLDPAKDTQRLIEASAGFIIGLIALALIFGSAIRVLTRESMTLKEVAVSTDKETAAVRAALEQRYKSRLPAEDPTLLGYERAVEEALKNPATDRNAKLLESASNDNVIISADAGFQFVKKRFDELVCKLKWTTPLAVIGFGLFAWAANPPKPSPPPPAFSFVIQGATGN